MQTSSNPLNEEPTSKKKRSKSIFAIITNSIGMLTNGYLAGLIGFVLLILFKMYGSNVVNGRIQDAFTYAPTIGYLIGQFGKCIYLNTHYPAVLPTIKCRIWEAY